RLAACAGRKVPRRQPPPLHRHLQGPGPERRPHRPHHHHLLPPQGSRSQPRDLCLQHRHRRRPRGPGHLPRRPELQQLRRRRPLLGRCQGHWHLRSVRRARSARAEGEVEAVSVTADQLQPGALCTLLDVAKRVPGYSIGEDGELDEILSDLIIQESADLEETTGREIAATDAGVTRVFDLTPAIVSRRTLPVGDLTTATKVELFDYDETTSLGIIDPGLYV